MISIFERLAHVLQTFVKMEVLTRRDVLMELRKMGVKKPSLLKSYLRDFERYIGIHYDFNVLKTRKRPNNLPNQKPGSYQDETSFPRF